MNTQFKKEIATLSAAELIQQAKEHPPDPVVSGMVNVGDALLIHGAEESFKSVFVLQLAECIAAGAPLLRYWTVPTQRTVGVLETEIHETMLGQRLGGMFSHCSPPDKMRFLSEEAVRDFRQRKSLEDKFAFILQWIEQERIDILVLDTVNDFFRFEDSPSDERSVGSFFDKLRSLNLKGCVLVRHDRKKKIEDTFSGNSNEQIRGSAEWKEDPETILYMNRKDRRTNEVVLEVGKLRYGSKPEPISLWFDSRTFRLTPLPPVIALLEAGPHSRAKLISECQERFGLAERKVDEMLRELRPYLHEKQEGHGKVFEIDWRRVDETDWYKFLITSGVGSKDMQSSNAGEEQRYATLHKSYPLSETAVALPPVIQ